MCGRYSLNRQTTEREYDEYFRRIMEAGLELKPRYNIAPQQTAPVIRMLDGSTIWEELRWGFRPAWVKEQNRVQINARAETVFESRMFKPSALKRRCLVPATGWYEWQVRVGGKQPYYFHKKDGGVLTVAGIWTTWHGEDGKDESNYAIITTEANPLAAPIHNRMPAILNERHYAEWLDPEGQDVRKLAKLLHPYEGNDLDAYPVGTYVNKPANTGAECVRPLRQEV
jgi:putative SOS response-associated peptidase YedK